ncbi:MAG TPA: hypothetical protein VEK84_08910 [Terriglobales bacterium]|nr:hypothetical protein [Terriglobales bacterium]
MGDDKMGYQRPLVIIGERKEDYKSTEADKIKGVRGGYFCALCKSEVVLSASSPGRIASQPEGTLLCAQCAQRSPVVAWHVWKQIAG